MRRRLLLALSLVLATLAAACASGTEPAAAPETTGGADTPAAAGDEAFPVTIGHRHGETTIAARPERVVTVGLTDQDAVLALGVAPVGVTEWFGGHPHAAWPWARDLLGDAEPVVVGDTSAIGFEQIAALRPDLILAVYAGLTESDYGTLSQIAPTVAQPDEFVDYGVPWEDQTRIIGRALGQEAEADALVDEVTAEVAAARDAHPAFEGATGLVASPYAGSISVYAPEDSRGRFLASLGFVQPPEIAELAGDGFSADLSYEQSDLLDVDALVWIVNSIETDVPRFEEEPLYAGLDVHTEGRDIFVENLDRVGGATSFVTVLSVPVLVDELVPQLAAAVDGT